MSKADLMLLGNQSYKNHPDCRYDFVRPDTSEVVPLIVYLHGGGWISGDKSMYRDEAAWACGKGFAAACVSYRLAPLYPFPAAVADCQAFFSHIRSRAGELGIHPNQIVAFGNSAGGHLAAMAGLCQTNLETGEPASPANAVVSVCGITDLREPQSSHYPLSFSFLDQFMGTLYSQDSERWALASPLCHVHPGSGPFLIIHGSDDEIVPPEQATKLYTALCNANVSAEHYELPGEGHAFSSSGWLTIREKTLAFLKSF